MAISFYWSASEKGSVSETSLESHAGMNKVFKLPIQFEQNEGQTDSAVRYLTRGPGYTFYFKPQEVAIVLTNRQGTNLLAMTKIHGFLIFPIIAKSLIKICILESIPFFMAIRINWNMTSA